MKNLIELALEYAESHFPSGNPLNLTKHDIAYQAFCAGYDSAKKECGSRHSISNEPTPNESMEYYEANLVIPENCDQTQQDISTLFKRLGELEKIVENLSKTISTRCDSESVILGPESQIYSIT